MKKYYIVLNGKQEGPFTFEELKNKINLETFVWFEGLEKWIKAKELPELKTFFTQTPPPFNENEYKESNIPPIPDFVISNDYVLADYYQRILAVIINTAIYLFIWYLLIGNSMFSDSSEPPLISEYWDFILSCAIWAVFNSIFYPFFSGTIGHKIMGIKVVTKKYNINYSSFFEAIFRELVKNISVLLLFPCIWIFFNKERRCIHDYFYGTIVVKNISKA
jgi:uncharacterized RDD family membrane protein YckC